MKKMITPCLVLLFGMFTVATGNPASDGSPLGTWAFNVNQAPWEYNKGTITFEEDEDGELTGYILFHTGQQIPILSISIEDSEMTFDVSVDGYDVRSIVNVGSDELTGHVVTMEGNMPFNAEREVAEGAGE